MFVSTPTKTTELNEHPGFESYSIDVHMSAFKYLSCAVCICCTNCTYVRYSQTLLLVHPTHCADGLSTAVDSQCGKIALWDTAEGVVDATYVTETCTQFSACLCIGWKTPTLQATEKV